MSKRLEIGLRHSLNHELKKLKAHTRVAEAAPRLEQRCAAVRRSSLTAHWAIRWYGSAPSVR